MVVVGCNGLIADPSPSGDEAGGASPGSAPARDPEECVATGETAIGPGDPWRLTVREYEATVTALLGRQVPGLTDGLPTDPPVDGYDNQVAGLRMTTDHASAFAASAERVVSLVVSDAALRRELMGCDVATGDRRACLQRFITSFGRRAYRRPITSGESDRLIAMAETLRASADASGSPLYGGLVDVAAITAALLQSPSFLIRITVGQEVADRPDRRALSGHEVATRLAYLLWGEGPDDGLLDAADAGTLDTVEGLETEARRMIADARTRLHLEGFFRQWLGLGRIFTGNLDPERFPEIDAAMQEAMYEEARRLLDDHAWSAGVDFMDVYTAPYGYADAELARLYGVPSPGGEMGRVELGAPARRAGLLSTALMLAMTSHPTEASIVNRGLLVRETVLCDDIPPPPPNVPDIDSDPTATAAELQDRHTADPVCAGCHVLIDPIGYGLETYDAIGRLRTDRTEEELRALPRYIEGIEGSEFYGGVELGQLVREAPEARECMVEQLFQWGMGREAQGEIEGSTCSGASLTARFEEAGGNLTELLVALATSDELRFKSNPACE